MVLLDHHYQITQLPIGTAVPHMLNADFYTEVGTRYFQSTDDNGTNTFPKKYRRYDIRYFLKKVPTITVLGTAIRYFSNDRFSPFLI